MKWYMREWAMCLCRGMKERWAEQKGGFFEVLTWAAQCYSGREKRLLVSNDRFIEGLLK